MRRYRIKVTDTSLPGETVVRYLSPGRVLGHAPMMSEDVEAASLYRDPDAAALTIARWQRAYPHLATSRSISVEVEVVLR